MYRFEIVSNPEDAIITLNGETKKYGYYKKGTVVNWVVSKNLYESQSGSITIDKDSTISIDLELKETWKQTSSYKNDGCTITNNNMGSYFDATYKNGSQGFLDTNSAASWYSRYIGSTNTSASSFTLTLPKWVKVKSIDFILVGGNSNRQFFVSCTGKTGNAYSKTGKCNYYGSSAPTSSAWFQSNKYTLEVNDYIQTIRLGNSPSSGEMSYGCYMAALKINT